jgi:phasin family protein
MNDTIKDVTEKGQAYIADITAKAKTAAEKGTKAVEEMTEFSKGNVEALVESGKIAAKGLETLGQGYADYARKSFESTTAAFKTFAGVKSPTDFFKLHSEFVKGQFDSIVAETSKNTEAMIKLAGDVAQPISNRVAIAAEKLKIAA